MDVPKKPDVPATEIPVPTEISPALQDFYARYKLALTNWFQTHPRQAPPVYEDPVDGKLKWANRDMRKRMRALKRR